eukprot:6064023-Pleurochrysis_carterae.AAC.1
MEGGEECLSEMTKRSGAGSDHECKGDFGDSNDHLDTVTCGDSPKNNRGWHSDQGTDKGPGRWANILGSEEAREKDD